jgi:signal transduction histidine kinase
MLDLAQADAMIAGANGPVDLSALAEDLVALMAPLAWAGKRDIRFIKEGSPVVDGHAEAIARALRNLVENALRHTPEGTVVAVTAGPGPMLSVRDHGPGVSPENRLRVFERFWRADRELSDGAGLGLGIVQSTMEAHGGEARVEDAKGGGALFVLDFGRGG